MGKQIIPVVAACISEKTSNDMLFLLHRKVEPRNPELVGKWEFPGGMIEYGETPELALKREIREELNEEILIGRLIHAKTFIPKSAEHYLILYYECYLLHSHEFVSRDCTWFAYEQLTLIDALEEITEVANLLRRIEGIRAEIKQ